MWRCLPAVRPCVHGRPSPPSVAITSIECDYGSSPHSPPVIPHVPTNIGLQGHADSVPRLIVPEMPFPWALLVSAVKGGYGSKSATDYRHAHCLPASRSEESPTLTTSSVDWSHPWAKKSAANTSFSVGERTRRISAVRVVLSLPAPSRSAPGSGAWPEREITRSNRSEMLGRRLWNR